MNSILAEAREKLSHRLSEIKFEDKIDICHYISLASRLKALGDSSYFDRIPEICEQNNKLGTLDSILSLMARMGAYDCKVVDWELCMCIIEAQDFYLFSIFYKGLNKKVRDAFAKWFANANASELDKSDVKELELWKNTYPLPEELLLPVMANPVATRNY